VSVEIVPARVADLRAVQGLLEGAGLPLEGLTDQFPDAYVIVSRGGELVGVAGVETYGSAGLLRSVAVAAGHRGAGVGRALVADRLARAAENGQERVFLLTTSAAPYFEAFGFSPISRTLVPASLLASPEFASACPASAACLFLDT
jgi:N-acetylglutamate synthase-like GNAT family acetyltransferase